MKPQDILFIFLLAILIYKKSPKLFVGAALICLLISMPLFQFWIFFSAQRLVAYSFVFLLIAVVFFFFKKK